MRRSSLLLAFARLADITGSLGVQPRPKDPRGGDWTDAQNIRSDWQKVLAQVDPSGRTRGGRL
jgi:hypothetical protein